MSCSVVILAAGQGKRMQSQRPKVLHTLGHQSFIEHVISTAQQLRPDPLVVVYGHQGEQVQTALSHHSIKWAKQMPPQGTGHAVQQALPLLPSIGTTVILYGDVPLIRSETLDSMVQIAQKDMLALLTIHLSDPNGYGRIVRNNQRKVIGIIEHKDASSEQQKIKEVNTGMMAMPTQWLHEYLPLLNNDNAQKEYYLTDLIKISVASGNAIETLSPKYPWEAAGVNDRVQQADLEKQYQRFQADHLMKQGVSLRDPDRFDLRGTLECDQDVEIDVNCIFEGHVKIGKNVKVGPNCLIRNSILGESSEVEAFSYIDGATIGAHSKVGPFARLRPGTALAQSVHIGNFVEVKNSQVDECSKVNHLSYIGDAAVGKRVNIGAGTITCNYDGVNKHRTIIGNDVFVGSATQLIAPVLLADGVTVAAGTTVWRNVPDENALVLNTKKQQSRLAWLRPRKTEGK